MSENTNGNVENEKIELTNRNELISILQNFSNLRTGQDQVLWNIIGAFWTTNSLLIVSFFSAQSENEKYIVFIIPVIGLYISWLWKIIQKRALLRIKYYEDAIIDIEDKLKLDYKICSFNRIDSKKQNKEEDKNSARYNMERFSYYSIFFWIVFAVFFILKFLTNA